MTRSPRDRLDRGGSDGARWLAAGIGLAAAAYGRMLVSLGTDLRANEINAAESVFRTETRAIATDAHARRKFRRYWSLFSPGIILIRWAVLRPVKREAERRVRNHGLTL